MKPQGPTDEERCVGEALLLLKNGGLSPVHTDCAQNMQTSDNGCTLQASPEDNAIQINSKRNCRTASDSAKVNAKRAKIGSDPLNNTSGVQQQQEQAQQNDSLLSLQFYNPFMPPTQVQHMNSTATETCQTYTAPPVLTKHAEIQKKQGVVRCSIKSAVKHTASTTHLEGKTGRQKRTSKHSHKCKEGVRTGKWTDCISCHPQDFCMFHRTRENTHPRRRDCTACKKEKKQN